MEEHYLMQDDIRTFWIDDFTCAIDVIPPDAIAIRRGLNTAKSFTKTYSVTNAITVYTQARADTITQPPPEARPARAAGAA